VCRRKVQEEESREERRGGGYPNNLAKRQLRLKKDPLHLVGRVKGNPEILIPREKVQGHIKEAITKGGARRQGDQSSLSHGSRGGSIQLQAKGGF